MSNGDWEYVEEEEGGWRPLGKLVCRRWNEVEQARRNGRPAVIGPLVLGVGGLIGSAVWWAKEPGTYPVMGMVISLGCMGISGLTGLLRMAEGRVARLDCHTNGVSYHPSGRPAMELRFDEIERFKFAVTEVFTRPLVSLPGSGDYLHTLFELKFAAADGRGFEFKYTRDRPDEELDTLKHDLARHLARAWQSKLASGHPVKWTKSVTFEADGVSVVVSDNSDDDLLLDWDDVLLVNVKPGRFALTSRRTGRQVKELTTSTTNFFPGFFLLDDRQKALDAKRKWASEDEPD
jgi:hypothetical protein